MNKTAKRILIGFSVIVLFLFGMICFGLYSMEIEDHYGDLQNLYYQSNQGDVILNKTKSEFGFVSNKTWKRIDVNLKDEKDIDIYKWLYKNNVKSKFEIYHPETIIPNLENESFSELEKHIAKSELKLVYKE